MDLCWRFEDGKELILAYAPADALTQVDEIGKPGDAAVCLDIVGPVFIDEIVDEVGAKNVVQGDDFSDVGEAGELDVAGPVFGL